MGLAVHHCGLGLHWRKRKRSPAASCKGLRLRARMMRETFLAASPNCQSWMTLAKALWTSVSVMLILSSVTPIPCHTSLLKNLAPSALDYLSHAQRRQRW